mmetsp:Transcript_6750/g.15597  ORF Transcript_6750/g.15597 Transcript_6750/m.15597 type:complete len:87 (-) Transcript_6750:169-429(-)
MRQDEARWALVSLLELVLVRPFVLLEDETRRKYRNGIDVSTIMASLRRRTPSLLESFKQISSAALSALYSSWNGACISSRSRATRR